MDIECGDFFTTNNTLADAVANGAVTEDMIDAALFDLFSVQVPTCYCASIQFYHVHTHAVAVPPGHV